MKNLIKIILICLLISQYLIGATGDELDSQPSKDDSIISKVLAFDIPFFGKKKHEKVYKVSLKTSISKIQEKFGLPTINFSVTDSSDASVYKVFGYIRKELISFYVFKGETMYYWGALETFLKAESPHARLIGNEIHKWILDPTNTTQAEFLSRMSKTDYLWAGMQEDAVVALMGLEAYSDSVRAQDETHFYRYSVYFLKFQAEYIPYLIVYDNHELLYWDYAYNYNKSYNLEKNIISRRVRPKLVKEISKTVSYMQL